MVHLSEALYQAFFKRSTVYIPMLLVGAYFSNEAIDYTVNKVWTTHNKGRLFSDMIAERG